MFESAANHFRQQLPNVDFCSLRVVKEYTEVLSVTRGTVQPPGAKDDFGAMVTVIHKGGLGYAATSDLSASGIKEAIERAKRWAVKCSKRAVYDFSSVPMPHPKGQYTSPVELPYEQASLAEKIELLKKESDKLTIDERIVSWDTSMMFIDTKSLYITWAEVPVLLLV